MTPAPDVPAMKYKELFRPELVAEFRTNPFGRHSPDLHALLLLMRRLPFDGKHCLFAVRAGELFQLGKVFRDPSRIELVDGCFFTDIRDAEWHVFKERWSLLGGLPLDVNG